MNVYDCILRFCFGLGILVFPRAVINYSCQLPRPCRCRLRFSGWGALAAPRHCAGGSSGNADSATSHGPQSVSGPGGTGTSGDYRRLSKFSSGHIQRLSRAQVYESGAAYEASGDATTPLLEAAIGHRFAIMDRLPMLQNCTASQLIAVLAVEAALPRRNLLGRKEECLVC